MQRYITAIAATSLLALSAAASAGQELQPVTVRQMPIADCAPPTSAKTCDAWHQEIRRNFSERQIGMLFGARTAYPEYRTTFASVENRYNHLLESFAALNNVSPQSLAGR
jgi:hypothetical protein